MLPGERDSGLCAVGFSENSYPGCEGVKKSEGQWQTRPSRVAADCAGTQTRDLIKVQKRTHQVWDGTVFHSPELQPGEAGAAVCAPGL
jgi:hypothetical protein